jgi:hypothetical protein
MTRRLAPYACYKWPPNHYSSEDLTRYNLIMFLNYTQSVFCTGKMHLSATQAVVLSLVSISLGGSVCMLSYDIFLSTFDISK